MEEKKTNKSVFDSLVSVNVNEHTEKKNGLTYLSWSWAWAEVKKRYPDAKYDVIKFDGVPYVSSPLGIMVYTTVTIDGITHEMWLPVMDSANNAMKESSYTVKTKYNEKIINAATMFDVNKAIMRCLVKNLAMFGLGLYIYSGEDLPEEVGEDFGKKKPATPTPKASPLPVQAKPNKKVEVMTKFAKLPCNAGKDNATLRKEFVNMITECFGETDMSAMTDDKWDKAIIYLDTYQKAMEKNSNE